MLKEYRVFISKKWPLILGILFLLIIAAALRRHTIDFYPFWCISRELLCQNLDLYKDKPAFSYPPFFYCIIVFFAQFTFRTAQALWMGFSVLLLSWTAFLSLKLMNKGALSGEHKFGTSKWSSAYLPVILGFFIIMDNLNLGQSNLLVLFLCTLSTYLFEKDKPYLSGIAIAAAIAVKITPALFLLYFLYRRGWKVFYGTLAGFALFFFLIPSLFFGFERNLNFFRDFINLVILPFARNDTIIRETVYYTHTNQSMDAFLIRHFTDYGQSAYPAYGLHKAVDPAWFTVENVKRASALIKLGLLVFFGFLFRGQRKSLRTLEYGILFLLVLFLSPSSWLNHYALAIFTYYAAVNFRNANTTNPISRKLITFGLILAFAFTATCGFGLTPLQMEFAQSFSGMFVGHFLLLVCMTLAYILGRKKNNN